MNFPKMTTKTSRLATLGKALTVSVLSVALALPTYAQKTTELPAGGGGSAHVRTEWIVAPANITIEYGRPSLTKRGETTKRDELVLMKEKPEWRAGADAATIITTDKALKFGGVTLQPGTYTINIASGASGWQILFGKLGKAGQWGIPYQKDLEVGRAPLTAGKTAASVELVTFMIQPAKSAGTLKIEWGNTSLSTPFTVLP